MKRVIPFPILGMLAFVVFQSVEISAAIDPLAELDKNNVVWDSPSVDARGSMPIGNGDIGLNVWVEPSGDLCFFIGKTDAWDENMRLLKLGKVRVRLTPALVQPGQSFSQTLELATGRILIRSGNIEVAVWVDANHPIIQVDAKSVSGQSLSAEASFEPWRTVKRPLNGGPGGGEYHSTGFTSLPAFSWPDTVLDPKDGRVGWYHRNGESPWLASLKLQKVEEIAATQKDPILHRTCGAILCGDNFVCASPTALKTQKPAEKISLRVQALTRITDTPEAWQTALEAQVAALGKIAVPERAAAHAAWWKAFWGRSWIFVEGADDAKTVKQADGEGLTRTQRLTRGYTLQRFVNACGGRGAYPIKFNGSLFTVDHCNGERNFDADFRLWGGGYWFQNTRLTYWSMFEAGDFDLMRPFFDFYMKALPARKVATKKYYGHEGAFFPEVVSIWGLYLDQADLGYGTDRNGKPDGMTDNSYIRRHWDGGLEMVAMMLEYYDHTQDGDFRDRILLPYAREIVAFYDQHWQRGGDGKILYHPAQSLETWWDAKNPMPTVAGMRYVLPRLLTLPADEFVKSAWRKTLADLPPVPVATEKDGKAYLTPAETYGDCRNVENPELYAIFPFRLYTLAAGKDAIATAEGAWVRRRNPANRGWQQNAIQAALLGHAAEAGDYVCDSTSLSSTAPGFRFQAFWGPNYDWMPDQDHGTVMMSALQRMLVQYEGDKILVLPAWPKDWNVSFKLHAPKNTTVEGVYRAGKLEQLEVKPESRRKDIVISQ